jgi:sec-independent protein translocase protein TatA
MNFAAIFGLGPWEIVIIVLVLVILFLPALIPKLGKRLVETYSMVRQMANKHVDEEDEEPPEEK